MQTSITVRWVIVSGALLFPDTLDAMLSLMEGNDFLYSAMSFSKLDGICIEDVEDLLCQK